MKKKKKSKKPKVRRVELSSEEFKVNLKKLRGDIKNAYETMTKVLPEAVKDVKVKRFGNASHIILPKEYSGKRAIVLIKK
jgi:putative transposon-encoded protein